MGPDDPWTGIKNYCGRHVTSLILSASTPVGAPPHLGPMVDQNMQCCASREEGNGQGMDTQGEAPMGCQA